MGQNFSTFDQLNLVCTAFHLFTFKAEVFNLKKFDLIVSVKVVETIDMQIEAHPVPAAQENGP